MSQLRVNTNLVSSSTSSSTQSPPASPSFSPSRTDPSSPVDSIVDNTEAYYHIRNDYVMVIGGLGYIGSHTTLELLKSGHNVIIIDDLSNAYESTIDNIKKLAVEHCSVNGRAVPTLKLHKIDYRSSWMSKILGRYANNTLDSRSSPQSRISGVIHFAAFKSVEESIHKPIRYYQNNIGGLVDLLDTLEEHGIKNFVFSSSATVYGSQANAGKPLFEEDLIHHLSSTNPSKQPGALGLTSPYGRTKYFAEAILADIACADPTWKITALRYFNPVGCHPSGVLREDPRQQPTNLFPVIGQVLTGQRDRLEVFGTDWDTRDGTAVRDFIHVVDLAKGHIAALDVAPKRSETEAFRTYNLGTGTGTSVKEVVDSFETATGETLPVHETGRRDGDVGFCVADTQRAEQELNWTAEIGMEDAAGDTVRALLMAQEEKSA